MKLSLYCPKCSRLIADLNDPLPQVTCAACQDRYGVLHGKLSKHSSMNETLLFLSKSLPSIHKRHYTFQITTPDRNLKQLQFSIPGQTDPIPVHYGDVVSVLYTMQGYLMKKLVAVTNHTTGKRYVLPNPVPSSTHLRITISTAVLTLLVGSFFSGSNIFLASIVTALGTMAYLKVTNSAQLTSPPLEAYGREANRLIGDQRLLAQKLKIDHRIDEINHECKSNQGLIARLEALKQKMVDVDQALYAPRIFRTTGAVKILKQQITNNQRLVREYRRALQMIEIEVETSWIADQLPDASNFTRAILQKLEELRAIEDQNQFLKLQLAAYEEVQHHVIPGYEG
ncbi:hypothetical protein H6F86_08875 [Phormidium sp. FACHB-592]|uniref:Uncharacterized protein n=1 Tax=Stenomitos frigidus AS-A4 TaxID=2933935 RepID=A0ABV0KI04_9CYAN|nr:hypothetical protein [Phormidium sp. FACHB-592]MBD2073998.1 hypothetical protein [Phormidium sp. FACHB-592]